MSRQRYIVLVMVTLLLAACSSPKQEAQGDTLQTPQRLQLAEDYQAIVQGITTPARLADSFASPENYIPLVQSIAIDVPNQLERPVSVAFSQTPEYARVIEWSVWKNGQVVQQDYQLLADDATIVQFDQAWLDALAQDGISENLELRVQLLAYDQLTSQSLLDNKKPYNSAYGLLHIPTQHYQADATCTKTREDIPSDVTVAADNVVVPEGKTPLVLIHGWQVFFQKISLVGKSQYTPGFCNWVPLINGIVADSDSSLRDRYEIFVFDYDSYLRVQHNAERFSQEIARVFGDTPVVLVGHSMGGMVANTYVQNYDDNVRQVVSLGTPYRGTSALVCTAHNGEFCTSAKPNPEISLGAILGSLHLLDTVIAFDGTLDLTWQYGGYEIGKTYEWCGWWLCSKKNYSVENAFTNTLNQNRSTADFSNYTAVTLTIDDNSTEIKDKIFSILQQAIESDTGHQNDMIVPMGSACMGVGLGASPDFTPCAERLIQKQMHFEHNHVDVIDVYETMKTVLNSL